MDPFLAYLFVVMSSSEGSRGRLNFQLFEITAVSPGESWVLFNDIEFVI